MSARRADAARAGAPATVFITGASRGLGAALAREYVRRGARVGGFARNTDALAALAVELGPSSCATWAGDVRDAPALAAASESFLARWGVPDLVIANAGISRGTLTEFAEDQAAFRATFETNVLGLVHTFQPFLAPMRSARRGTLAGIASVAGFRGLPGAAAYSASKAAAISYLESLRVELHGSGLGVVTVCPGYIDTAMTRGNPYPMPFRLPAEVAARRIARAIDAGRRFCVVPWQMAAVGAVLRWMPRPIFDRLLAGAPRKPRDAPV